MNSHETSNEPRPLIKGEVDHTRSKDYVLARGANAMVQDLVDKKYDVPSKTKEAEFYLAYPGNDLKEAGLDDIAREQRKIYDTHPERLSRRQRALFRISDKLEGSFLMDLIEGMSDRPSRDDKNSYWGYGRYRHMSNSERLAYRRSQRYQ